MIKIGNAPNNHRGVKTNNDITKQGELMIVTKEQLVDIIQLAKVMVDNHPEEVEGNPSIVKRIELLAEIEDYNKLEITSDLKSICNEACGALSIEVYSAILNAALKMYEKEETFKLIIDKNDDINRPKAVILVAYYLRYVVSSEVLKIIQA